MEDRILYREILEGLVHNLNNPLNLVLGFAQRLVSEHPEIQDIQRIYTAGLKIDDTLKQLVTQILEEEISSILEEPLNSWLDKELVFLQHYLPIKRKVVFRRNDKVLNQQARILTKELREWYESVILSIIKEIETDGIFIDTGICMYGNKVAVYIDASNVGCQILSIDTGTSTVDNTSLECFLDVESSTFYGCCK